jgi:hypothetical protein
MVMMSACVAPEPGSDGDSDDGVLAGGSSGRGGRRGGGGGSDGSTGTGEGAAVVAASYALHTRIDLTVGALAPEPGYELLSRLASDPGSLIVSVADAAGVPAADRLFDALPSTLQDELAGWMSDAISASPELQLLVAWSQVVLAQVELDSELAVGDFDGDLHALAEHSLSSLSFDVGGEAVTVELPQLESLPGAGRAEVDVWLEDGAENGALVFGEQRFGLLLGEAAYRAFQATLVERFGRDVRGVLGDSVDCVSMAASVADQCVLGVCVGHDSEISSMCEEVLNTIDDEIHDQFRALDLELMRLGSGEAALDVSGALRDGIWDASLDLGQGLRAVPAAFESVER